MSQLKVGALLQGDKYKIEKFLDKGGFGITYQAIQEFLDRKVCIKEFFLKEYCERDEATSRVVLGTQGSREMVERFMKKFLKEALTISKLEHPNIIRIYDIFKENNTIYYVMDYIDGGNLKDMVKSRGALPEAEAVAYVKQVASALDFVHQRKVNHLDVKPGNIMVSHKDNKAILIDFGVSKQYDAQGDQTSATPVAISHGYAPIEQYKPGGVSTFSPQTDIYALGATLYKLLTGETPPQAPDLINEKLPPLPSSISKPVVEAIKKAMQFRKVDRPSSISEFLEILHSSSTNEPESPKKPNDADKTEIIVAQEDRGESHICEQGEVSPNDAEVANKYRQAAEQGDAEAQYKLGMCYYNGDGVPQNYAEAVKWFRQAAEQGHPKAQYILGYCYEYGDGVPQNSAEALKWWRKAAEQGHASAQYYLGYCYEYGFGVPQNYTEAVKWYRKAAEQGDAYAQFYWGYRYKNGRGVPKDKEEAVKWYRKAAEQGHAEAQNNLGECYHKGEGVPKNYAEAAKWYRKAAEQGRAEAQNNMGECYHKGEGVPKNYAEAAKWYRKAAEQGDAYAQYNLGTCYDLGEGVPRDIAEAEKWYSKAVKWYRQAAERGYADAQNKLGVCYFFGVGVIQDYTEAAKWYHKAAEQGDAEAQFNLGECYYNGWGVPKNYTMAVEWWRKAAEQGNLDAQDELEELARSTTPLDNRRKV